MDQIGLLERRRLQMSEEEYASGPRGPAGKPGPEPARLARAGGAMNFFARISLLLVLAAAPVIAAVATADDHRAAIEILRERISDGPGVPADWRALGDALAATGEAEDALAAYRNALDGGVAEPFAVTVAMADLSRQRDLYAEADALLEGVIEDYDPQSDDAAATLAAGDAAARLGERDPDYLRNALDLYERAIRLDPSDPAPKIALGELLLDKYNNTEALPLFREVLAADPDHVDALLGLARSQYFDHSSAAVDTVRRALELEPGHLEARVFLGRLLIEASDFDGAAAEADAVLAVNSRHPGAWTLRAALAMLRADQETFDAHVATVFEHAPGYREAWVTLAEIAAENRLYNLAVQFSQAVVRRYPDYWPAYALLGLNQYRLGQIIWGRRNLETAFRGDPYNVWIKNTLELMDRADAFVTESEGRFTLSAPERDAAALAPILFPLAEAAYDALAERYGHGRAHRCASSSTTAATTSRCAPWDWSAWTSSGVSFGPVVSLVSPADMDGPLNWGSVLWHELAHTFHMSMSGWRVPRWFTEGLSVVEERLARPGWGADVSPGFLEAWAADRLPPVSRLDEAFIRPTYPNRWCTPTSSARCWSSISRSAPASRPLPPCSGLRRGTRQPGAVRRAARHGRRRTRPGVRGIRQ
ncbi:MAG: tetratricopeptide repeat protein [Gammaproteobacteria bacterium]|nr:tetratricopeptide repeat protein [Gammaproteobacteria bacterium]